MSPLEKGEMPDETTPTDDAGAADSPEKVPPPASGGEGTSDAARASPAHEEKKEDDASSSAGGSPVKALGADDDDGPAPAPEERGLSGLAGFYSAREHLGPSYSADSAGSAAAKGKGKGKGKDSNAVGVEEVEGKSATKKSGNNEPLEEAPADVAGNGEDDGDKHSAVSFSQDFSNDAAAAPPVPPPPNPLGTHRKSVSRDLLSRKMTQLRRRHSLTAKEFNFLEQLVVHGNEAEVETARTKLADADLFFERHEESFGVYGAAGGEKGEGEGADVEAAAAAAAAAVAAQEKRKSDEKKSGNQSVDATGEVGEEDEHAAADDAVNMSLAVSIGSGSKDDGNDDEASAQLWMDTWVRQSPTSSVASRSPTASPRASPTASPPPQAPRLTDSEACLAEPEVPPPRSPPQRTPQRGFLSSIQRPADNGSGTDITVEPQTSVVFGSSFAKSKPLPIDGLSPVSSFLDDGRSIDSSPSKRGGGSLRGSPQMHQMPPRGESSLGASEEVEVVLEEVGEGTAADGSPGGRSSPVGKIRDKRGKSIGTIELDGDAREAIQSAAAAMPPQDQDVTGYNSLACAATSPPRAGNGTAGAADGSSPLRPGVPLMRERRQRSQSMGSAFSALSMGSVERRVELDNRRRQAPNSAALWRAHENGLTLTREGSLLSAGVMNATRKTLSQSVGGMGADFHRRSKSHIANVYGGIGGVPATTKRERESLRRSSSVGRQRSVSGGTGRRPSRADSFLSTAGRDSFLSTGTLELLELGGPTHREGEAAVFRREEEEDAIFRGAFPPVKTIERERVTSVNSAQSNGGRTVSSLGTSDNSQNGPGVLANLNITALNLDEMPAMPFPNGPHERALSSGSRVTFADENHSAPAALEDGSKEGALQGAAMKLLGPRLPPGASSSSGTSAAPSKPALRRRSSRDLSPTKKGAGVAPSLPRPRGRTRRSISSSGRIMLPPSMQQGPSQQSGRHHRYVRSESQASMGSIPSIHHARALRSSGSIASAAGRSSIDINNGSSVPSIRIARALRSSSILSQSSQMSIPAIMHAHHLRSDSVLSARSLASVPSLRPGRPVRSDSLESSLLSFGSNNDMERLSAANGLGGGSRAPSPDVAAALAAAAAAARGAEGELVHPSSGPRDGPAWSAPNSSAMPPRPSGERPPMPPSSSQPQAPPSREQELDDSPSKPVLMRRASRNIYGGEGIEVTEMMDADVDVDVDADTDTVQEARNYRSMISTGADSATSAEEIGPVANSFWLQDSNSVIFTGGGSFDEGDASSQIALNRRDDMIDVGAFGRELKRSLSDEQLVMQSGDMIDYNTDEEILGDYASGEDDASWDLTSNDPDAVNTPVSQQDAWNVLKDEYAVGYGANGAALPFLILGTSADDITSQPHVLSPPLMESLQCFLPYAVSEDNFWMKFSMVRDGASLHALLQTVRGASHTVIAIETVGGEVFGSFTSSPWRKNWNYFGTGESFLWRMRQNRGEATGTSVIEQAELESDLDVYPWTGENNFVQLCTHDKIAVGGGAEQQQRQGAGRSSSPGSPLTSPTSLSGADERKSSWEEENVSFGFGLAIDSELLHGTSSPCLTFGSPSLSKSHADGSPFEILNMEVWTLTPCISVEEAEKLELGRLFLDSNKE